MNQIITKEQQCYVCNGLLNDDWQGRDVSQYSKTPVFQFLEKIIGQSLGQRSSADIWCLSCLNKIDDYDEILLTAKRIEAELLNLYVNSKQRLSQSEERADALNNLNNYKDKNLETDSVPGSNSDDQVSVSASVATISNKSPFLIQPCKNMSCETDQEKGSNKRKTNREEDEMDNKCVKCNVKFEKKSDYKQHILSKEHKSETSDNHMCNICGQTYKSKAALNIHIGMHKGVSPHECLICGKKFTQKVALTRHMPLHTGQLPHQVRNYCLNKKIAFHCTNLPFLFSVINVANSLCIVRPSVNTNWHIIILDKKSVIYVA